MTVKELIATLETLARMGMAEAPVMLENEHGLYEPRRIGPVQSSEDFAKGNTADILTVRISHIVR